MIDKEKKWEKVYCRLENVVTRKIADETILVPISGNLANMQRIFTLNEVGAFIWSLMDGKTSAKEIRQQLLQAFDVIEDQLTSDMWEFIERLKQSSLILDTSIE